MTKVLVTGTFDILHPGHLNFFKQARQLAAASRQFAGQARQLGDFLIILIARDNNVIKAKGHSPYFNEKERLENLQSLLMSKGADDYQVMLGDLSDPYKVIKDEKPDIIALGYDQQTFVNGLMKLRLHSDLHFKIERLEPFKEELCKGKRLRSIIEDQSAGFLFVDKPMDWTSFDVVAKLRSITKIKQIGHSGTLDPFATGLLVCGLAHATKMAGLFNLLPKTYEAEIRLGVVSDTYDRTGQVSSIQVSSTCPLGLRQQGRRVKEDKISKLQVQNVLKSFIGKQKQIPPMYSAKKVQGKKLYELARQGMEVERQPAEIEIYDIEFLSSKNRVSSIKELQSFKVKVQCSAGTYIRTLAHDIGQKLGTGAVLWELKRTASGGFSLADSVKLEQLTLSNYQNFLKKPGEVLMAINRFYWQHL